MYKHPLSLILLCMVSMASFSCGSTLLFDNFSGEVVSNLPPHDIPGAPIGDTLTYDSAITPKLKVIQDGTSRALSFSDEATATRGMHKDWLSFVGVETDPDKPILVAWTAKLSRGTNDLLLFISDGYGNYISRLTLLKNGEIRAATDLVDYENYPKLIGRINFDKYHIFTVRLDPLTNTCNIGVVGVGVTSISDDDPRMPVNVTMESLSNLASEDRKLQVLPRPMLSLNWTSGPIRHQQ
ncbi:hypothetical protein [Fibrella forsythiae]|uniref:Lipoprotein n=1 Tax=Fibrella forsythiae TaxID=2817061 RepID=A0ABS3JR81_9BACT|nr:hypothetical protein [Fibrella forsythiae]MBO0952507.1 hypothetical protein [Fibrella forsythiae]